MANKPAPIIKVREIKVRCHAHATESQEKVLDAIKFLLDLEEITEDDFSIESLTGANGNLIRAISINLTVQRKIKAFLQKLGSSLPVRTKGILISEFDQRMDEKYRFYFRLEKQNLVLKQIKLASSSDMMQVVICFQNKNPKAEVESKDFREYLKAFNF